MANDDSIESLRCRLLNDMKAFTAALDALDLQKMRYVLGDMRERVQMMAETRDG